MVKRNDHSHDMLLGELNGTVSSIKERLSEGNKRFADLSFELDKQRLEAERKRGELADRVRDLERYQWKRLGARAVLSAIVSALVTVTTIYLISFTNVVR